MAARKALGVQALLLWPIGPRGAPALGVVMLGVSDPTQEKTALAALAQEAADLCLIIVQRARSAEAQALAASVYQALGEAIVVASAAGEIQALNPAFQQLTGYRTEAFDGGFVLDTRISGNHNSGHEYGTALPEDDRWALVEYLKTL